MEQALSRSKPTTEMNRKGLAILMRTRIKRPPAPPSSSPSTLDPNKLHLSLASPPPPETLMNEVKEMAADSEEDEALKERGGKPRGSSNARSELWLVRETMRSAISMNRTEVLDSVLNKFTEGYYGLSRDHRRELLMMLAKDYDLNRAQVRELMKQYIAIEVPSGDEGEDGVEEDVLLSTFFRMEKNLRHVLKPTYEVLFERLNTHPGGLKFLSILRADILSIIEDENIPSLRTVDSFLKEKLITWLSPAALELHHITWDDPASLLEKIVAYEAVHPISSLIDLKRRLGVGRRCFGYLHPAIPGEPLIFIEVALMKTMAQTIQEVLWDDPPQPESDATCALFYSISSAQPGLAGINLGKFLIKRVIELVKRDMPHISTFATLSPIPGYMRWLLSKLTTQLKLAEAETSDISNLSKESAASAFRENILQPGEEIQLLDVLGGSADGKSGLEVLWNSLNSRNHEWSKSDKILSAMEQPLMRLCSRYLLQEKKRGKALDSVANFHLQNGAMIGRLNWMADRSEKGLAQSGGIMVNYVYRLEAIEEHAHSYFSTGNIDSSPDIYRLLSKHEINNG
ncbi:hypothetical protein Dimus_035095 [Dionaea muscipula]